MQRLFLPAVFLVALAIGTYFALSPSGNTPDNPLGAANADELTEVDTSSIIEMQIGNPDAPVTVIEYASFTCPHCATFHTGPFKQLKADYIDTGKINFIYREVYFDRYGLWASALARCTGPDKFFGIADLLYASQSDWARAGEPAQIIDSMRRVARLAGLDSDTIEGCLQDNDKLRTLVAWYEQNRREDDISSTPSFVINGTKYGNLPYSEMAQIIDDAAE